MIKLFSRGSADAVSGDFVASDFDCRCKNKECTQTFISMDLAAGLTALRAKLPGVIITSAFRCAAHNRAVGGGEKSMHLLGLAADIYDPNSSTLLLFRTAETIPDFRDGGMGYYRTTKTRAGWVHVDCRNGRARW